jgi:DNA polymerase-3 subunit epsilon
VDYFVVDVETANASRSSICQIGIARFSGGKMTGGWQSLIQPEAAFSPFNIGVHGITPKMVADAPTWFEVYPKVDRLLSGAMVASHTNFDHVALSHACREYGMPMVRYQKWIDTCRLARHAWPKMPNHKLTTLAHHFGIEHKAHDALEDARAAGEVLSLAMEQCCVCIEDFLKMPGSLITAFPKRETAL